jgi:predicted DNA-binding WGR domain protein
MNAIILYRTDRTKNMQRFYRLDVQRDLFGYWCCIREWGRIGRSGQTREESFGTINEAQRALERQRHLKERRGYSTAAKASLDQTRSNLLKEIQ